MTACASQESCCCYCAGRLPLQAADLADAYTAMRRGDFTAAAGVFESAARCRLSGSPIPAWQAVHGGAWRRQGRGAGPQVAGTGRRNGDPNAQYTLGLLLLRGSEQNRVGSGCSGRRSREMSGPRRNSKTARRCTGPGDCRPCPGIPWNNGSRRRWVAIWWRWSVYCAGGPGLLPWTTIIAMRCITWWPAIACPVCDC